MNAGSPIHQELEALLRQEISPEQFYRSYLDILMNAFPEVRGFHLWLLQGSQFVPLGGSDLRVIQPEGDQEQTQFILHKLQDCGTRQRTVVSPGTNGEKNPRPLTLAFTPLLFGKGGGALQGAQVSWWEVPPGRSLSPELPHLLDECGRFAARMARLQKLETMSQIADRLQLMTRFLDEVAAAPDLASLAAAVVNRAREIVGCDRCALLIARPDFQIELKAISNVPIPDPRSTIARTLCQIADNARTSGLPVAYRKATRKTEEMGDLSDYFFHSKMEEAVVWGVQLSGGEILGLLVFESEKTGGFSAESQKTCAALATHTAGPLCRAMEFESLPALPLLRAIGRWRRLPPSSRRHALKRKFWIPAAVLLAIVLFPVGFDIPGDLRLMPTRRALAIAETPGRVVEVLVADGDEVTSGQVLARIDDSEQRKQAAIAAQEEARIEAESGRLQAETDRVAARVSQISLERARREREFHEAQIERAVIRSPIDGIVMSPDLASRHGEAMAFGTQFALVGDPRSWEVEIMVSEADVAEILSRLRRGKPIPVRFVLNAIPQRKFRAVIGTADDVSAVSEVVSGKNVFRIAVALTEDEEDLRFFRAGFTGRAKLKVGTRPFGAAVTRRFFNWIRTHVLF
jgi:hypothetical protein